MGRKLPRSFYLQDTLVVAKQLLGMHLVRESHGQRQVGRIVETEAYQGPEDLAAHTARARRTPRNEAMYGPGGHAYVYFIYGMFHCFNVVTRERNVPHAVLIRALEPLENIEARTSGPGLLCRALGIDRSLNGTDLRQSPLYIEQPSPGAFRAPKIRSSPRIGVDYAGVWAKRRWRFFDDRSAYVSKRRPPARPPAVKGSN